ncbi:hypothetical protein [Amycolatopsis japonica]|uniref:hypothetical protein n=1 Tax=Amycolatopsis japonica TaxID=208439 RepID=UPI00056ED7A9|nr:hypothetical protein [Amycolatopsis japonica]
MSGDAGEPSPPPGISQPKNRPAPGVLSDRSGHDLKTRIWIGLPLAVVGAYLIGDGPGRLRLAWDLIGSWWPWALAGLAAVNLLRSLLRTGSLLAPGILAFAAMTALAFREGVAARPLVDVIIPAVIVLTGMTLLLSAGSGLTASWTRFLVSGRVIASVPPPDGVRPRAILGELKADLSPMATPPEELRVTAIFGHVHLTIPATWQLDLRSGGTVLTPVRGPIGTGPLEVRLSVLGFCGLVDVVRAPPAVTETA